MLVRTYQRRKRVASQGDGSQDSPWDSQESLLGSSQESYEDDPDQPHSQSFQWNSNASEYAYSIPGSKSSLDDDSQNSQGKSSAAAAAASILMPPPSMRSRGKSKASRSKEAANTGTAVRAGLDRKRKADQAVSTYGGNMQKILPVVRAATRTDSAGDDSQSDLTGVQADNSKEVSLTGTIKSGTKNAFSSWIDVPAGPLSTLTDAQDRGQMIEYIDEANFAMTGLSRGQAVRMIRASLVTMAQLCKSTESRRLLRNHGFHRPLLEAVLDLELGDPALSLGAAAILYFLAIDEGHDTDIWESKKCLQFLFRLLQMYSISENGVSGLPPPPPNAGGALGKKNGFVRPSKASDAGGSTIEKLKELFRKQEHGEDGEDGVGQDGIGDKDISATQLALLTLQKACSSPIVLEEVGPGAGGGRAAKSVEHFKERLRQEGGLETVAELASQCLTKIKATAQEETKSRGPSKGESFKREAVADTTGMLLRCLRVMENVTFLNQANQRHLIQLIVKKGIRGESSRPFIAFLLDTIDTLSAGDSTDAKPTRLFKESRESGSDTTGANDSDLKASRGVRMSVRDGCGAAIQDESGTTTKSGRPKQLLENGEEEAEQELKGKSSQTIVSVFAKKKTVRNSTSLEDCPISSGNTELHPSKIVGTSRHNSAGNGHEGKEAGKDPFAFDEDSDTDDKPVGLKDRDSSGEHTAGQPQCRDGPGDLSPLPLISIKEERDDDMSDRGGERQLERMQSASPSPAYRAVGRPSCSADSTVHGVVENCLISAVKVLMNLSNENVYGCRQVALAGGLHTISALAVTCCKSVALSVGNGNDGMKNACQSGSSPSGDAKTKPKSCSCDDMDLLIVVLGVLVNLVEKDESNRTELASLECTLVEDRRGKERKVGMVPFLCALFASKQGASELHKEREEHGHEVEAEVNAEVNQKEAEAMMVEAYAALLLAFLSRAGANSYATMVQLLPGVGLEVLVPVLEHFFAFHQSLNAITPESYASAKVLIESIRQPE